MTDDGGRLLTTGEAAAALGVAASTLRRQAGAKGTVCGLQRVATNPDGAWIGTLFSWRLVAELPPRPRTGRPRQSRKSSN